MIPNQSEIEQYLRAEIGRLEEEKDGWCELYVELQDSILQTAGDLAEARRLAEKYRDAFI